MSFLDGILSVGKSAVGFITGNGILSGLARTAILGYAVNRLSQNAIKGNDPGGTSNIDNGVRLQVKPNASSKIPVLYGSAFFGGNISDAAMTNSNKTMWYAIVLSEKTGNVYSTSTASTYTLNNVYWNNQRIVFNSDGITVNYTVDSGGIVDRSLSGLVKVYFYAGGRTAGQLPSGFAGTVPNAETLFPNWTSGTHEMDGLVFALVRVDYNREKNVTGLGDMLFQVTNSLMYPGDVLYDYLTNTTYGAGISSSNIVTADITALNTYSQESVAYDSPSGAATLADRYQINGLLDTDKPVLENAEKVLSAAASWLSYDTHEGKWGIVINKSDSSVASFDDTNILGSISLSGTGLQDLYNSTKVEFPHRELKDSADYYNIEVPTSSIPSDWTPFSRNTNEEDNILNLSYDIINEPIQAQMLGLIELKQSRLDKVIKFETDFGKYNLKAGDIVSVTNSRFGFSSEKFRIVTINEIQDDGGALLMEITALQYNVNVYSIDDLYRFARSTADGIVTIGSIGQPGTPVVSKIEVDARPRTEISSTAPTGVVEGLEFWITTDTGIPDDANRSYTLVGVKKPAGGGVFTSGTTVTLEYIPNPGNFYVKTRGFNATTVGVYSDVSGLVEFAPTQVTDGIGPETSMFNSTGGLIAGLAAVQLLGKLGELFSESDVGKSLFDQIFKTFEDVTGIDLVGDAAAGDLVVSSDLAIKSDGTSLGATTSSLDFIGPLEASGSGDISVKITDGIKNKDVLAWNKDEGKWQTISDCVTCDFENIPPADGPETPCLLSKSSTLPVNNFQAVDGICPTSTTVPYKGSYFIKFAIQQERLGAVPQSASSITPTDDYQWEICKSGNTDFTYWGAPSNTVGTKWYAKKTPSQLFPNGKNTSEITIGKRYAIKTLGSGTSAEIKTAWTALGWEGATSVSNPTVGDEFTAIAVGTKGTVDAAAGSGFVYGQGAFKNSTNSPGYTNKTISAPLVKGTGNFKLYGTDGKLEQTVAIDSCTIWNDVVEIPFKDRAPGKDYYIIWDEGIITSCACENTKVDSSEIWTFTTSETPVEPYKLTGINPKNIASDGQTNDVFERSLLDYTYTPKSSICSNSQKLILTFTTQVIKGTGSITIKNRETKATVASLSVSGSTISEILDTKGNITGYKVDFGTIPSLETNNYYDIFAPRGLLKTESSTKTETVCDKTTSTPAPPERKSMEKTWGIKTDVPLKVVNVDYCKTDTGNAKLRTNIKITFNKPIAVKATSPAEIGIYGGFFGTTFQKIDLRGTYANKKYGTIYEGADSSSDDPTTASNEEVNDYDIIVNPTMMFKPATDYHIEIPSGVIIDTTCDSEWEGVTDSTTIAWKTDGAEPTPPQGLTYGSVLFDLEYDRPILPGYAKMNITVLDKSKLKTQISARDIAVQIKYNQPFDYVEIIPGITRIRPFASLRGMTASLVALVDNVKFAELGTDMTITLTSSGRRIRYGSSNVSNNVTVNASIIRNVGTMTPTTLTTIATLRL